MRFIATLFFALLTICELPRPVASNNTIEASSPALANSYGGTHFFEITGFYFSVAQSPVQYAKRGDVASGRIIREENDELDLDTSPCDWNRVVRFHKPYDKTNIRQANCGDKAFDRTQVEQK
jgi:hypothetical protein